VLPGVCAQCCSNVVCALFALQEHVQLVVEACQGTPLALAVVCGLMRSLVFSLKFFMCSFWPAGARAAGGRSLPGHPASTCCGVRPHALPLLLSQTCLCALFGLQEHVQLVVEACQGTPLALAVVRPHALSLLLLPQTCVCALFGLQEHVQLVVEACQGTR
jgi:integral membrane sensor domain MASE1